jgi:tRNA G18 (ribose-2'-O)-methylase SpoU
MNKNQENVENIVILHNIRSAENVGSMFRTAEAAGVKKIYLTGYTPTPIDNFGRKRKDIAKTALGAEDFVNWEQKKNIFSLFKSLGSRTTKLQIIGIEQDENSIDYKKLKLRTKNVFIVGNEVKGLSKKILFKCDVIAEIPMHGKKESLNVSVALGIVLFNI